MCLPIISSILLTLRGIQTEQKMMAIPLTTTSEQACCAVLSHTLWVVQYVMLSVLHVRVLLDGNVIACSQTDRGSYMYLHLVYPSACISVTVMNFVSYIAAGGNWELQENDVITPGQQFLPEFQDPHAAVIYTGSFRTASTADSMVPANKHMSLTRCVVYALCAYC